MNTQALIPIIAATVRWFLTMIGSGVALEAQDDITKISGAIAALISFAWSVFDKYKVNKQ